MITVILGEICSHTGYVDPLLRVPWRGGYTEEKEGQGKYGL